MQCILGIPNALTMAVRALSVVLLFSAITALSGKPLTPSIADLAVNTHEEHTLSTELQPPPSDAKEYHDMVYVINVYALKNKTGKVSEDMFQKEVIDTVPDILEPLATVLLVQEEEEEKGTEKDSHVELDNIATELRIAGFEVDEIELKSKAKVLKIKLKKEDAQNMIASALKPDEEKKDRKKRTICLKCSGGGGGYPSGGSGGGYGGGYGGGGYPSGGGGYPVGGGGGGHCPSCGGGGGGGYPSGGGGGYYPPSGGGGGYQRAVIPVVVIPITGGGGHRGGGGNKGGGGYPSGGGGYPSGGGSGCSTCSGGGGGGGGAYAQSSASAQASSGSWGK